MRYTVTITAHGDSITEPWCCSVTGEASESICPSVGSTGLIDMIGACLSGLSFSQDAIARGLQGWLDDNGHEAAPSEGAGE